MELRGLLLAKDGRVRELERRLGDLSIALEEEKRSHISALELVQELREAEEVCICSAAREAYE